VQQQGNIFILKHWMQLDLQRTTFLTTHCIRMVHINSLREWRRRTRSLREWRRRTRSLSEWRRRTRSLSEWRRQTRSLSEWRSGKGPGDRHTRESTAHLCGPLTNSTILNSFQNKNIEAICPIYLASQYRERDRLCGHCSGPLSKASRQGP